MGRAYSQLTEFAFRVQLCFPVVCSRTSKLYKWMVLCEIIPKLNFLQEIAVVMDF